MPCRAVITSRHVAGRYGSTVAPIWHNLHRSMNAKPMNGRTFEHAVQVAGDNSQQGSTTRQPLHESLCMVTTGPHTRLVDVACVVQTW